MIKKFLVVLGVIVLGISNVQALELEIKDKVKFMVNVARTISEQKRGLMFVHDLPEDEGMLFDFRNTSSENVAMWMKNTYISLDVVFLDCGFKVVDIYRNAVPLSLDIIQSSEKFCYVLEIGGGNKNVQIGDRFMVRK